jgi:chorismate mutase
MHRDDSLQQIRSQIEKTDEQIVLLLAERQSLIHELARIKKAEGIPVIQNNHWISNFQKRMLQAQKLGLSETSLEKVFDAIHEQSIAYQEKIIQQSEENNL